MTLIKVLKEILNRLDTPDDNALFFSFDDITELSGDTFQFFLDIGFIKPAKPSSTLICEGCEERCIKPVEYISGKSSKHAYISCDERQDIGLIKVNPERLKRWQIDFTGFVKRIVKFVGINETPRELINSRLWSLRKYKIEEIYYNIFFARGLTWTDAKKVFIDNKPFNDSLFPIIFVPTQIPKEEILPNSIVLSLESLFVIEDEKLSIDIIKMKRLISVKKEKIINLNKDTVTDQYVFRKEGYSWLIVFEGKRIIMEDYKGLQDIKELLLKPYKSISSKDLFLRNSTLKISEISQSKISDFAEIEEGFTEETFQGFDINDGKKDFTRDIQELENEIEEAKKNNDIGKIELLNQEREFFLESLSKNTGLGGRKRKMGDDSERFRKAVSKRINDALKKIKKEHNTLWQHLDKIDRGYICKYKPEKTLPWKF